VVFPGEDEPTEVRGQVAVATTAGTVQSVRVDPGNPPPCPEALQAVAEADQLILDPGSWYTSVTAPLLVPSLREAILASAASRALVLNLCPQSGETSGFAPHTHLEVWARDFPDIQLHQVVADPSAVADLPALERAATDLGAALFLRPLASGDPDEGHHDPDLLAAAFGSLIGRGRITPWR